MMKRFPILIFAIFIDTFQALMGLALTILPAVGAVAGGLAGWAFCTNLPQWQWVQTGCSLAGAAAGALAGSTVAPIGLIIAPVVVFCIGLIGGTVLLVTLAYARAFNGRVIFGGFLGEVMPFFGFLPFWTGTAWYCIREAAQREKSEAKEATESQESLQTPAVGGAFRNTVAAVAMILIGTTALGAHSAFAQVAPDPVRFILAPENPGPNEVVIIQADGVGVSLGSATFLWQRNGKTVLSGVGEQKLTFTTGPLGSPEVIGVTVQIPGEGTVTKTFNLTPSLVHLLWEADTTTPFFYRGAALYSPGSRITVVAFPNVVSGGKEVSSRALSYTWSVNGAPVPTQSGLGHTILTVSGDQLQDGVQISVDVLLNDSKVGHGELSIPNTDPQLLLYYRDSLRGILYDTALPQNINLTGQELAVRAEPYYFSNSSLRNGDLAYTWLLDGTETTGPDSANGFLTLRRSSGAAGSATISVSLQNTDSSKLGQSASAALQVLFGAQANAAGSSLGAALFNAFGPLAQVVPAGNRITYQPLEPIPGYSPGACTNIADFLNASLKLLIIAGAIFSVLTLTVGGVMYMMSDIVNVKSKAKDRMWAAIWGLILIIAAYLILNTINPQLVNFGILQFSGTNCGASGNLSTQAPQSIGGDSQIKTVAFNTDSNQPTANIVGNIGARFGIYPDSETRASFGCTATDVCALASQDYLSFSDAGKSSADIEKFKSKCESGQMGTSQYIGAKGYTKTVPGDAFGDNGKTDMFCFVTY